MNPFSIPMSQNDVARFAAENIAPRHDLPDATSFPFDLWKKMSDANLFRIGLEDRNGYTTLTSSAEAFVRSGHNMGLALSWLYEQLIAKFILKTFANSSHKQQYLDPMTQGKLIVSFCVSEPKHGPHPKLLSTTAKKDGHGYVLHGEKTYLTNGPVAGLFIVIAVTDEGPPRKRFTAFLIPRETAGLTVTDPMPLPFFKPALHGGILLSGCRIPESAILGEPDSAYEKIAIPFSMIEDVAMTGNALGAMAGQLDMTCEAIRRAGTMADEELQAEVGTLAATLGALRTLVYEAAGGLDRGAFPSDTFPLSFSDVASGFQQRLQALLTRCAIALPAAFHHLQTDLNASASIRRRTLQNKRVKLGSSLLNRNVRS